MFGVLFHSALNRRFSEVNDAEHLFKYLLPTCLLGRNVSLKCPLRAFWLSLNGLHAKSLQSCPTLCNPTDCSPPGSSVHGDSPGKNTRVGCHALLQGIFPTQGSNLGLQYLPHFRQILYPRAAWEAHHQSHYLLSTFPPSTGCPFVLCKVPFTLQKTFYVKLDATWLFLLLFPFPPETEPKRNLSEISQIALCLCFLLQVLWFPESYI